MGNPTKNNSEENISFLLNLYFCPEVQFFLGVISQQVSGKDRANIFQSMSKEKSKDNDWLEPKSRNNISLKISKTVVKIKSLSFVLI